jgi:hypothetical protein
MFVSFRFVEFIALSTAVAHVFISETARNAILQMLNHTARNKNPYQVCRVSEEI